MAVGAVGGLLALTSCAAGHGGAASGGSQPVMAAPVLSASPAATPTTVAPQPPAHSPRSSPFSGPAVPAAASARPAPRPLPKPLSEPNRVAPSAPTRQSPTGAAGSPGLWPGDFPDPFVLPVAGAAGTGTMFYAYSTQSGTTQVQTLRSPDLAHWEWVGEALPRLPPWAAYGYLWGPSVLARPTGYVLYYATRQAATGRQCISLAVSLLPQGPFVDTSSGPFICQLERGGSIDPSPFVDADGTPWLVWKSEGTLAGEPTRIWAERLSPDGRSVQGQPGELMRADQPWELPIVEGPSMVRTGGRYLLTYAGSRWETPGYAIGYALCTTPAGPCRKPLAGPVMGSSGSEAGPGSPSLFFDATGALRMAYHAWTPGQVGYPGGARRLHIAAVSLGGDTVTVHE